MNRRTALLTFALAGAACSSRRRPLIIGSKDFTEQLILGELLAQFFAQRSISVERRFYLMGTYICHQALLAGRIDLYVEYTGTALAAILKLPPPKTGEERRGALTTEGERRVAASTGKSAASSRSLLLSSSPTQSANEHQHVYELVRDEYRHRFNLEVFPSLGFDNNFAIVVRGPDARSLELKTISDLARHAPAWRMGVGYEFLERQDGYRGLTQTYGLRFAGSPRVMDLGLLYRALESRQVDVIAASNTDGLIAALDLRVLADDRHYFPPYDAVPIVRPAALQRYPDVEPLLRALAGRITTDQMRRMNYAVDAEHKDAREVAAAFLAAAHLR
jgi:osmoprotectant transport system substrate-binding protein